MNSEPNAAAASALRSTAQPSTQTADELARTEITFKAAARRRYVTIILARILILVAILGGWELGTRFGWIDPFFFASPSGIAAQIWDWITEGTSQGPLSEQIIVTLEET